LQVSKDQWIQASKVSKNFHYNLRRWRTHKEHEEHSKNTQRTRRPKDSLQTHS